MGRGGTKGNRGGTGRPPKPVSLHILKGTFRKDRHESKVDLEPVKGGALPPPPADLDKDSLAAWKELAEMVVYPIYTKADIAAFRTFATMWHQHKELSAWVNKKGISVSTPKGESLSPEAKMWSDLNGKLLAYFARFGMTPADRARVAPVAGKGGEGEKSHDPDAEFA